MPTAPFPRLRDRLIILLRRSLAGEEMKRRCPFFSTRPEDFADRGGECWIPLSDQYPKAVHGKPPLSLNRWSSGRVGTIERRRRGRLLGRQERDEKSHRAGRRQGYRLRRHPRSSMQQRQAEQAEAAVCLGIQGWGAVLIQHHHSGGGADHHVAFQRRHSDPRRQKICTKQIDQNKRQAKPGHNNPARHPTRKMTRPARLLM